MDICLDKGNDYCVVYKWDENLVYCASTRYDYCLTLTYEEFNNLVKESKK